MFSDTLLDHFQAPRNVGDLEDADAMGEGENPVCGDRLRIWLRVRNGRIDAVRWRADGCAPAIAAASVASELLQGMTVEEARELSRERIVEALGGLPTRKAHAAMLVVSTVGKALSCTGNS